MRINIYANEVRLYNTPGRRRALELLHELFSSTAYGRVRKFGMNELAVSSTTTTATTTKPASTYSRFAVHTRSHKNTHSNAEASARTKCVRGSAPRHRRRFSPLLSANYLQIRLRRRVLAVRDSNPHACRLVVSQQRF